MNRPETTPHSRRPVPAWSSTFDACRLVARGVTFPTASRVALAVGTLLSAVNQGAVIVDGHATTVTWIRVVVNYFVPFTVASIGYLAPSRVHRSRQPRSGSPLI